MREFNNWIKSVLIDDYCFKLGKFEKPSVLDLCSGKGGDLAKWNKKSPSHYVAFEYSKTSTEEALERFKGLMNKT